MATVSRGLPPQPHLDVPRREARELLDHWRAGRPDAVERIRGRHPRFQTLAGAAVAVATFKLADAQLVIAREYGFSSWAGLKRRIEANDAAGFSFLLELGAPLTDDRGNRLAPLALVLETYGRFSIPC